MEDPFCVEHVSWYSLEYCIFSHTLTSSLCFSLSVADTSLLQGVALGHSQAAHAALPLEKVHLFFDPCIMLCGCSVCGCAQLVPLHVFSRSFFC